MNVPTPLNDNARDDRFDRGLDQLLHANPAGLDEIEPELQEITLRMVQLANDAGWIGSDPGEPVIRATPRWRNLRVISNAVAAIALIGVVSALAWFGIQYLNDDESQYGSPATPETIQLQELRPAACTRSPRSDADIATIVRKSPAAVTPFTGSGIYSDMTTETLQLSRDWNACLQQQDWARATAYESEYFIWVIGRYLFQDNTSSLTDSQIADEIRSFHLQLEPLETPYGIELTQYWSLENVRVSLDSRDNNVSYVGVDIWVVPLLDGEWYQWPWVVTAEWDGTQWVIVSTSQASVPPSPFKPSDNQPTSVPTPD